MNTMQDIQGFVAEKTLAIAGLSRDEKSFSAVAFKELKTKGYKLYPVNPNARRILGEKCYPSVAALPGKVGGVLVFTSPAHTEKVVREARGRRHPAHLDPAGGRRAMRRCASARTTSCPR